MKIKYIIPNLMESINPFYIFNQSEDIYTRTALKLNFGEYDILFTEDSTVNEAYNTFIQYFVLWKQANADRIARIKEALEVEYNPIENMSLTEVTKSVVAQGDIQSTSSHLDYETTTSAVTYDAGLKDENKVSVNYSGIPTTDTKYTQDKSMTIDGEEHTGNMASINSLTRHGNVGVQSNVGYILEEIGLRRNNYIYELLKDFVNEYCIYCSEG